MAKTSTSPGKAIAERMALADQRFIGVLMERGQLTAAQAAKAFETLKKAKAVKLDAVGGTWSVKHGAFLDREVLERAAKGAVKNPTINPRVWPQLFKTKTAAVTAWEDTRPGFDDKAQFLPAAGGYRIVEGPIAPAMARKLISATPSSSAPPRENKAKGVAKAPARKAAKPAKCAMPSKKNPPIMSVTHGKLRGDIYPSGKQFMVIIPGEGPNGGFDTIKQASTYAQKRLAEVAKNPSPLKKAGKAVKRLLAKVQGKRNPDNLAAEQYEIFHGLPSPEVLEYREKVHVHKHLWAAGTLVALEVANLAGDRVMVLRAPDPDHVDFNDVVMACFDEGSPDENGKLVCKQLYLRGGDQSIPLDELMEEFGMNEDDVRDNMVIGNIRKITYRTFKNFESDGEKPIDFWHPTGKEHAKGVLPILVYRPLDPSMEVVGGRMKIAPKSLGLGASPGIVG